MSVKRRSTNREAEARKAMDELFQVASTRDISDDLDGVDMVIPRRDIDNLSTAPLLNALYRLLSSKQVIMSFRQKIRLQLSGYSMDEGDPRNNAKVRQYFASVDKDFPYWFFFLQPNESGLGVIASVLCPCEFISEEYLGVLPGDLRPFLLEHFDAMMFIFETYQLPDPTGELMARMGLSVFEFFGIYPDSSINKEDK